MRFIWCILFEESQVDRCEQWTYYWQNENCSILTRIYFVILHWAVIENSTVVFRLKISNGFNFYNSHI